MQYWKVLFFFILIGGCSYKNIGEYGPNTSVISYDALPPEVRKAYKSEFIALTKRSVHSPVVIINLDASKVEFNYLKSTSIEIIRPGKEVYKIGNKRFYLPWNLNRELNPSVLFNKNIYMVYTVTDDERLSYYDLENLESNKYLKVDLSKHLKY